ncbi:MAG: hypothetical protein M5U29_07760 [Anaerolineae bacterium]|nr:hypothetical protein [Anaerolineae bacterium]
MGWLLELDTRGVRDLALTSGDPPLITLHTAEETLLFYATESGALYGREVLPQPHSHDLLDGLHPALLDALRAPNAAPLPRVQIGIATVLSSYDGRLHAIESGGHTVALMIDGERVDLLRDHPAGVLATGLDRELGTVGVLTGDGALHVFQQHVRVGVYPLDLALDGCRPAIFLPDGSGTLVVSDGSRTRIFDTAGRVLEQAICPEELRSAAAASAGEWIIRYGGARGVIRVYDAHLTAVRQGTGDDLRAASRSVQLFGTEGGLGEGIDWLVVADDGTLVFVQGRSLCCAHLSWLPSLPLERSLF